MSFESDGTLHITVPDRELENVKERIQDAVGTTEVGLTDGGTMSAQTARGGGRARRRARRSFRMEEERTGYLEESVTYLEEIEDHLAEGVGGGGGVVDDLIGGIVETGGDAAIEGGSILADFGVQAIGTAVGTAVSDAIRGSELQVEKPSWVPLAVEDVPPLEVEDVGPIPVETQRDDDGGFGVRVVDPDSEYPLQEPTNPYPVEDVPGPIGFEPPPGPIQVETPPPLEVEDVEPIDVEVSVTATAITGGQGGSAGEAGSSDDEGGVQIGGENGITIGQDPTGIQLGGDSGITIGKDPGDPTNTQSDGSSKPSGSANTGQQISVSVDVDNRNRITVETTTDEVVDDVMAEVEDEYGDAIDDLEAELQDAFDEIDALRDSIGGR